MPRYRYTTVDRDGQETHGELHAPDERAAAAGLRAPGVFIASLARADEAAPDSTLRAALSTVRPADRIQLYRNTALMLRSGMTLLAALTHAERTATRPSVRRLVGRWIEAIRGGSTFAAAMAQDASICGPVAVNLVAAGERSGELGAVLDRLADADQRRLELRRTLLTSLMYPSIVVVVALAVATFLVLHVVPKFAAFLAQKQIELPATTQFLMDLSAWIATRGPWLLLALVLLAVAFFAARRVPRLRLQIDRTILRIPIVGRLILHGAVAQVTQTLGTLLESGVTILEALRATTGVAHNRFVSSRVAACADDVLQGRGLAESLRRPPLPDLLPELVAVGEEAGALPEVLDELSRHHGRRLDESIRKLSALTEPVLILLVGGMVAFVYIAFFQAVLRLAGRA